jgi:hypothetical protein
VHRRAALDDAVCAHQRHLAQLREAEHWRRLVAARLDLAVAAVTDIDDLGGALPSVTVEALRGLLGVPGRTRCPTGTLLDESARLVGLRAALAELDAYTEAVRRDSELATLRLAEAVASTPADLRVTWTGRREAAPT